MAEYPHNMGGRTTDDGDCVDGTEMPVLHERLGSGDVPSPIDGLGDRYAIPCRIDLSLHRY